MNRFLGTLGLTVFAVLATAMPLQAQTDVWWDGGILGTGTAYEVGTNWEGDAFPADPNTAYIGAPGASSAYTLQMANDAAIPYNLRIGVARGDPLAVPGRAIVHHTGGTIQVTHEITIGSGVGSAGVLYQSGGTLSLVDDYYTRVGAADDPGYGYLEMTGGLIESGLMMGSSTDDLGVCYQTGGTITNKGGTYIKVSSSANAIGAYNLTGGLCQVDEVYLHVGGSGSTGTWGHMNVSGEGHLKTVNNGGDYGYIRIGGHASATGFLTLGTGGLIETGLITESTSATSGGSCYFSFHGGTLKVETDHWASGILKVAPQDDGLGNITSGSYIGAEGGTVDTNGFDVDLDVPLLKLEGYGVGSIAVTSAGSGYLGPPVVQLSGGSGVGASAMAVVDTDVNSPTYGQLTGITVTNPGSGYQAGDIVTVTLLRGGYSMPATVTATLTPNAQDGGFTKTGAGALRLSGTEHTYTGLTDVQGGTLTVNGSILGSVSVATGATLNGDGTIGGNVTAASDGNIESGASVGMLVIEGDLDMSAGANMTWEIGELYGAGPGRYYDSTVVIGDLTIGETSELILDFGLLAEEDRPDQSVLDEFWTNDHAWTIIDVDDGNTTTTGNFTTVVNGDFAAGTFSSSIDASGNVLLVFDASGITTAIPGDTNGDGRVDATDAQKLAQNWGAQTAGGASVGDFNGDGWVNAADAAILAANWGDYTGGESTAVPEPSTLVGILAGLLSLALIRRKS